MRRALYVLLFLALVAEMKADVVYDGKWETFMMTVGDILMVPLPIKFPLFDLLVVALLAWGISSGGLKGRARPMVRGLWLSLATIFAMVAWGLLRGGNFQQVLWQIHPFCILLLLAFMMMAVLRTPRDFAGLGKTVVLAAVYRGLMVYVFRTIIIPRDHIEPFPATMTTHGDTVLFVTAIVIVVCWALESRKYKALFVALAVSVWLLLAIYWNNRRLAYLSLLASLALVYILFPANKTKRRLNLAMLVAVPVIAAYLAVGWNKDGGMWKPVHSFVTMLGSKQDASSQTRDIENYNLMITLKSNPLLGSGWGHEYQEVNKAYSIEEVFPQYRYIPHNSVLGLLAFNGLAGFVGTWLVFPIAAFLHARTYRTSRVPIERIIAIVGMAEVIIYTNQMYGDMGFTSSTGGILMAASLAAAGRLSVTSGGWPQGVVKTQEAAPVAAA
jgi:hypothetical protein